MNAHGFSDGISPTKYLGSPRPRVENSAVFARARAHTGTPHAREILQGQVHTRATNPNLRTPKLLKRNAERGLAEGLLGFAVALYKLRNMVLGRDLLQQGMLQQFLSQRSGVRVSK